MELGNGWNLPAPILRKLRMLEYLADYGNASLIPPLPEWAQPGTDLHVDAIGDLEDFHARGWVDFEQDYGGGASIQLRGPGRAFIDDVRVKRDNRAVRYRAARDALLHWLYDQYLAGRKTPNLGDFTNSPFGLFYAQPFNHTEVNEASLWLREKGYLRGQGALGAGIIRPTATAEGIAMAESDRSVNDRQPIPPTSVISVTGSHNVVQSGSPGATQHVTTTITDDHRRHVLEFADALEQALPVLDLPPDAAALPDQLRDAANNRDDGALRDTIIAARTAMAGSVGTSLGNIAMQHLHPVLQALGLG